MALLVAVVVFITSLMALPISYLLNVVSHWKDQRLMIITSIASLVVITLIPQLVLRKLGLKPQRLHPFFYVISVLTFGSVLRLIIALENDSLIAQFVGFYLRENMPYLKTAHGTMIAYWDGILHYALYLMILAALSWNQSFSDVGLYWAGSFGNSILVLILSILMGSDGIKWSILTLLPDLVICIWACSHFLEEKKEEERAVLEKLNSLPVEKKAQEIQSLRKRPLALAIATYFTVAGCLVVFRFVASVGGNVELVKSYVNMVEPYFSDPQPYAKAQLIVNLLYLLPFYAMNVCALVWPGQSWVPRWALIHAGAAGQGQFAFMGSSLHYRTPYIYRVPQTASARIIFWSVNGLLLVFPQIIAYLFSNTPNFFFIQKNQTSKQTTNSNGSPAGDNSLKKTD